MKRRILGITAAALGPFVVLGSYLTDARLFGGRHPVVGYTCLALGLLVGAVNFYLSFLRAALIRRRTGAPPAHHVSGIPLLGFIVVPGLALLPASTALSTLVALQVVCDTGNLTWFVIATWRDDGIWGPSPRSTARRANHTAVASGLVLLVLLVLVACSFLGFYKDREWGHGHVFVKHRPCVKLVFHAPLGEADRSHVPGHEGHLTPEQEREERAYVEFIEEHGGYRRSIALPAW